MTQPGDLQVPPQPVNRILAGAMASEANLLGRVPLPFGLSLVAVVRKRRSGVVARLRLEWGGNSSRPGCKAASKNDRAPPAFAGRAAELNNFGPAMSGSSNV